MAALETFFDTATERIAFLYHRYRVRVILRSARTEPNYRTSAQRLRDEEHYSMPLCF